VNDQHVIHIGQLTIDLRKQRVMRAGEAVHLTRIEWALLSELASHPGEVISHRRLLQHAWGEVYGEEVEYVHTYLRRLRRKLEDNPSAPTIFVTESGIGYRFELPSSQTPTARLTAPASAMPLLINPLPLDIGDRYVGREREAAAIKRMLRQRTRLIGVYGRTGVGKTALVCKVLRDLLDGDDEVKIDGVVCLSAASAAITLRRVLADLRRLLPDDRDLDDALQEARTPAHRAAAVLSCFQRGDHMLFLDNVETLQNPASGELLDEELRAFVEALLSQGGGLRLVITSRDPLTLPHTLKTWERTILLDGGLADDEGVALLRLCDLDGSAGLRDAPDAKLRALAAKARGNPRALETIAGLLLDNPLRTLDQLLADDQLFAGEIENTLVRQALQQVDETTAYVLRAAALIGRPFERGALAAVVGELMAPQGLDAILARLVRAFFLSYDRATGHFDMHPMDRAYCYALIPAQGQFSQSVLHRRAAAFYQTQRQALDQGMALASLEPLLNAFHHHVAAGDLADAARLMLALDRDRLSAWGEYALLRDSYLRIVSVLAPDETPLLCACWLRLGRAYRGVGQTSDAVRAYERALALALEGEFVTEEVEARRSIAWCLYDQGQLETAVAQWEACLLLARRMGDLAGEAGTLGGLGWAAYLAGDYPRAIECFNLALDMFGDLGDTRGELTNLGDLGEVYAAMGDTDQGVGLIRHALDMAQQIGARREQSYKGGYLASALLFSGDLGGALRAVETARALDVFENRHTLALLHGIILACLERPDTQMAFEDAVRDAADVLSATPLLYRAHYARGLAGVGLAALNPGVAQLDYARDFQRARDICHQPGLLAGYRRWLMKLSECVALPQPDLLDALS
jgi:DNA-binding winged helix-turn-helix (wHTH) protein/tetratricopeptide (TPR) repeat protein